MKKILLGFYLSIFSFACFGQVILKGVSPAPIAINYDFSWADPGGGDWSCPDFNIANTYVEDTLVIVDDGSTGTNAQGNPVSAEGCDSTGANLLNGGTSIINDVNGKIAVIYRNTCEFGLKALNAQNAGAVGVIIVNREPEVIQMGGGGLGASVTIPVCFINSIDGLTLTTEMQNGPVVVFMGNKIGKFNNDAGSNLSSMMISRYGSVPKTMADNGYTFDLGIQLANFGQNTNDVYAVAEINDSLSNQIYYDSVGPITLNTADTLSIFNGNSNAFAAMSGVTWNEGRYTITYTIGLVSGADDDPSDNVFTSDFYINNDDVLSLARQDESTGSLLANFYPYGGHLDQYRSCIRIEDQYPTSSTGVEGVYYAPYTSKTDGSLDGIYHQIELYEWNDFWTGIDGAWSNITFNALDLVGLADVYLDASHVNGEVIYAPLDQIGPSQLIDDQRYLLCLYTPTEIDSLSFGYDKTLDYSANFSILNQPIGALQIDADPWYSGWSSADAATIGLKLIYNVGISSNEDIKGTSYPNPASDIVNFSFTGIANFNAVLDIYDITGKLISNEIVQMQNGYMQLNIDNLTNGNYIFNFTFEDGSSSKFNIIVQK